MSEIIKTITIYGASSSRIDPEYINAAKQLGQLMALRQIICINGGGSKGVMGAVTESMLTGKGKVIGIIPQFMVDEGWLNQSLAEVIITPDMHARKQLMAQKSDACIALPGGIGTMEELLEIMTWKQLGLYKKPLIILNTKGYYNCLLMMLDKMKQEHFIHHEHENIWEVAETPENALEIAMKNYEWHSNPRSFAAL